MAIVPALLATILVFLDQQITAVIVNRSEHKLKVRMVFLPSFFISYLKYIMTETRQKGCDAFTNQ